MELHQLHYVLQVAKHLNFSRAAAGFCVTQPNLSRQILKLEAELGVSLFERKTRSVKLTIAGIDFVARAEMILSELEALHEAMQEYGTLASGDIRIGILSAGGQKVITQIPAFQKKHPSIHIHIIEGGGSPDLLKSLQEGKIDIAYLIQPDDTTQHKRIQFYPLITGSVVLITCANHRFVSQKQIALAEAANENFIFPPRSHSIYNVALNACRASGFEPNITCECGHFNTIIDLVKTGLGISFASSPIVDSLQLPTIRVIPFVPFIERTVCLATWEDKHQQPVISVFRDFMINAINCENRMKITKNS